MRHRMFTLILSNCLLLHTNALLCYLLPWLCTGMNCLDCDNSYACGVCLQAIPSDECPNFTTQQYDAIPDCLAENIPNIGDTCEFDISCGLFSQLSEVNNCGGTEQYDVFERVDCVESIWAKLLGQFSQTGNLNR